MRARGPGDRRRRCPTPRRRRPRLRARLVEVPGPATRSGQEQFGTRAGRNRARARAPVPVQRHGCVAVVPAPSARYPHVAAARTPSARSRNRATLQAGHGVAQVCRRADRDVVAVQPVADHPAVVGGRVPAHADGGRGGPVRARPRGVWALRVGSRGRSRRGSCWASASASTPECSSCPSPRFDRLAGRVEGRQADRVARPARQPATV